MEFRIDTVVPASPQALWGIFFDVPRMAGLIPGCEKVEEIEPLRSYSAVLRQKVGPFKIMVPAMISVEEYREAQGLRLMAEGRDKFTGTSITALTTVRLAPDAVDELEAQGTRLEVDADLRIRGKLASLGFGVIKKKSEELFAEFERRLRNELETV